MPFLSQMTKKGLIFCIWATLNMKTLKKNWKNHEFSRCYLFFGEETYLIREYEAALRTAILPDGAEMMNEDSFEEKRATAAAIMDAAETLPFLND